MFNRLMYFPTGTVSLTLPEHTHSGGSLRLLGVGPRQRGYRDRDCWCHRFADCSENDTDFCGCNILCSEETKDKLLDRIDAIPSRRWDSVGDWSIMSALKFDFQPLDI